MEEKKICNCVLDFLSILDAISGINNSTKIYHGEKHRQLDKKSLEEIKDRIHLDVRRTEKAIERVNKSCEVELKDDGLLEAVEYRIEHDEIPERIYNLTGRLKNSIIADLTIQCR